MGQARHIAGDIVRDIASALAVLALVFLSYAHQPVGVATPLQDVLTAGVTTSFCGDLHDGSDGRAHAPCHACRIGGGADLPPACGGIIDLVGRAEPAFVSPTVAAFTVAPPDLPEARGPPALA